jgi:guanylate kinase
MNIIPKENRTLVYIDAGDWETLKARAQARAPISEAHLALRYERYLHEKAAQEYADKVIINKDGEIEDAKKQLVAIIENIVTNVASRI